MEDLRDLELRHLAALDAVATEGTFGRAAQRLGYTQSAVSQQIAALERVLGAPVFDRPGGPRPVELTPLGERVLSHARDVLARVAVAADDIARFRLGASGRLDIGTFQSVSNAILPEAVARMRRECPDVEIRLHESHFEDELEGRLISGELDLSFMVGTELPGLQTQPLVDDRFVLLSRPGTFAAGPVRIADLAGQPMIGQNDNSCQRLNESALRAGGCEPQYVFRTNDNGAVAALVRSGMGLAVLPRLCVDLADPGIELHDLDPPIPPRVLSLAWRADRSLAPAAERFVAITTEVCAVLAEAPFVDAAS